MTHIQAFGLPIFVSIAVLTGLMAPTAARQDVKSSVVCRVQTLHTSVKDRPALRDPAGDQTLHLMAVAALSTEVLGTARLALVDMSRRLPRPTPASELLGSIPGRSTPPTSIDVSDRTVRIAGLRPPGEGLPQSAGRALVNTSSGPVIAQMVLMVGRLARDIGELTVSMGQVVSEIDTIREVGHSQTSLDAQGLLLVTQARTGVSSLLDMTEEVEEMAYSVVDRLGVLLPKLACS
jgi:hypothetical protein